MLDSRVNMLFKSDKTDNESSRTLFDLKNSSGLYDDYPRISIKLFPLRCKMRQPEYSFTARIMSGSQPGQESTSRTR